MAVTYYFPFSLFLLFTIVVLVLIGLYIFINDNSKRLIFTVGAGLLSWILTGALIVGMVGEYQGVEFIAYIQNPLLGWVYLVASLAFTGISLYLAYRVFSVEQPVLDNRGFDL